VCAALAVFVGCGEGRAREVEEGRTRLGLEGDWTQQARLKGSRANQRFGISVAVSGNTALIDFAGFSQDGCTNVYERSGSIWNKVRGFQECNSGRLLGFLLYGETVAISDNTLLIGEDNVLDGVGSVNVYVRSGANWARQQSLFASDGAQRHYFGAALAISGDSIVVGTLERRAYVFVRTGSTWTEQQKLTAPDERSFGEAVAISGDSLVVLARDADAVHFYRRNASTWQEEQKVVLDFPSKVALEGNTALVTNVGGVAVFVREGLTWTQRQTLTPSNPADSINLLGGLALSGDTAMFGARAFQSNQTLGSVYVVRRDLATFTETQRITLGTIDDNFGQSLALSGETAVIGADATDNMRGFVYVFTAPPSDTPTAVSPSGPVDTNWPRYRFTRVDQATHYEISVAGSLLVVTAAEAGCAAATEFCTVRSSITLAAGDSTWRVRGTSPGGTTAWSNSLTVSVAEAAQPPEGAAVGIAPTGLTTATTPTYRWNAAPRATRYSLWVNDTAASGQPPSTLRATYDSADLGCESGGVCEVTPAKVLAFGPVKWWVRAENPLANSAWSAALDFTVSRPAPTLAPISVSPVGSVSGGTITYRFYAVGNAVEYFLWVNDHTGPRLQEVYPAASVRCDFGECAITPTTPPGVGPRTWWVRAQNLMGAGPWSAGKSFTITGGSPPGTATLLAPTGSITTATPTYSWSAVTGATRYQLWVGNSSGRVLKQFFTPVEAGCDDGTCEATPTTPVPAGSATWWIQADNAAGPGAWVSQSFSVEPF